MATISNRLGDWWKRRGWKLAPLLFLGVVPVGCVSLDTLAPPVAPSRTGDSSLRQHGREIYVGKCTTCHSVQPVADFTEAEWPGIVRDMAEKTKLTASEEQAVLAYVLTAKKVLPTR